MSLQFGQQTPCRPSLFDVRPGQIDNVEDRRFAFGHLADLGESESHETTALPPAEEHGRQRGVRIRIPLLEDLCGSGCKERTLLAQFFVEQIDLGSVPPRVERRQLRWPLSGRKMTRPGE